MLTTKYVAVPYYKVMDALNEKKKVLYLDREQLQVFNLNPLSVETVLNIIEDAEACEKSIGYDYSRISRYSFWYVDTEEIPEEVKEDAEAVNVESV